MTSRASLAGPGRGTNRTDYEPNQAWKDALRAKIEEGLNSMITDANESFQAELNNSSPRERGTITNEYHQVINNIRSLSHDTFQAELEREREERRRAVEDCAVPNPHEESVGGRDSHRTRSPRRFSAGQPTVQRESPPFEPLLSQPRETQPLERPADEAEEGWFDEQRKFEFQQQQEQFRRRELEIQERRRRGNVGTHASSPTLSTRSYNGPPSPTFWIPSQPSTSQNTNTMVSTSPRSNLLSTSAPSRPSAPYSEAGRIREDFYRQQQEQFRREQQRTNVEGERSTSREGLPGQGEEIAENVRRRDDELERREQELMRREEELRWGEEALLQGVDELGRTTEESWSAVRQKERDVEQREKRVARREEEASRKEQELQHKDDQLKERERELESREAELEATTRKSSILLKLHTIFTDAAAKHYRLLLKCTGTDAQTILDTFQSFLDSDDCSDRGQLVVAMRRLSAKTQLYPQRYLLDGPVQLAYERPVNAGRYADIYKAQFRGASTCLKVLRAFAPKLIQHMAKVYAREAIIWGQLSHPNLLPFYGLYMFRTQIAFVAPWAKNGNLSEYLALEPHVNRVLLCADIAFGVEYLHANDVVHGDLKALNVLVDGSGRACLSDFGLSGVSDKDILQWTSQSSAESKGGTTRWQAPELHNPESDNVHNTKATDVFAWASTCYEAFTGKHPFFETTRETTVAFMILRGDVPTRPAPEHPSWVEQGLTNGIWTLLEDCWRKEPSERPDISTVITRLNFEKPAEDPRPPGQWQSGFAMQFRNAQDVNAEKTRSSSLEALDAILSRVMDDSKLIDDNDQAN